MTRYFTIVAVILLLLLALVMSGCASPETPSRWENQIAKDNVSRIVGYCKSRTLEKDGFTCESRPEYMTLSFPSHEVYYQKRILVATLIQTWCDQSFQASGKWVSYSWAFRAEGFSRGGVRCASFKEKAGLAE